MITLGDPVRIVPPWLVVSPTRAAGLPSIVTVADPVMTDAVGPQQTA